MFKLKTFTLPVSPAPGDCFLGLVREALEEKRRVPAQTPDLGLGPHYVRENLEHLTVEKVSDGWVCNITFKKRAGEPDCITSSMLDPFETAAEALIFGTSVVCEIVSGSAELPFEVAGGKLLMATYGAAAPAGQ